MKNLIILFLGLSLICLSFVACGGGADEEEKSEAAQVTSLPQEQAQPMEKEQDQPSEGTFSWDNIPAYPGAVLESTGDCPAKWAECEVCEHRTYVTDDTPQAVCSFFEEGMPAKGWSKIVFQSYPEGSCMGTWMSGDSDTRVLMTIGKGGGQNKTFISITMGKKCP